jgi:hypothetical protein
MHLGKSLMDTAVVFAPNTFTKVLYASSLHSNLVYFVHNYSDTSLKTLTFYHNDANEQTFLDNALGSVAGLTRLKNFRGNCPQNMQTLDGSSYQQSSALTVAAITNWNSINTITVWGQNAGDGTTACTHMNFSQDFMQNNLNLQRIFTTYGLYAATYSDTSFKLTRLKTNWNTYFTNLQDIRICDDNWNREDLTALTQLNIFVLIAANQNHSNVSPNNPLIPIPQIVIDNVINQIAAGAGQTVSNGILYIASGGNGRTSSSNTSVLLLKSKGWTITVNGVLQ